MTSSTRITVLKYDRRLHIALTAQLLDDDGERLWFRSVPGCQIDHRTRGKVWTVEHPFDMVFWRSRWYNVYLNRDQSGALDHYYCNVALPPEIGDHTLAFVDLDLDVKIWPDGHHELLDEDEFVEHTALFAYPDAVQRRARQSVDAILALWRARTYPFDESIRFP